MNSQEAAKRNWKPGDLVLYAPMPGYAYGGVVDREPWLLGDNRTLVTTVRALGPTYQAGVGCPGRTRSCGVSCDALRPAPTEYFEGEWVVPGENEAWAMVTYTHEPSPETGHVGWVWWALGKMGDAAGYEEAKLAAVAALEGKL